jgi:hypothetical protein
MKCPQHPVLAHLQRHVRLSASDRNAIEALFQSCRKVKSGRELIRSGAAGKTFAVVEGWIARESLLLDGRQQITALFLPGDVFDLNAELIADCDYSLRAVTDSTVVEISRSQLRRLKDQPRLDEALCWEELEQLAISTEWLVNLGQRSASERIAHSPVRDLPSLAVGRHGAGRVVRHAADAIDDRRSHRTDKSAREQKPAKAAVRGIDPSRTWAFEDSRPGTA